MFVDALANRLAKHQHVRSRRSPRVHNEIRMFPGDPCTSDAKPLQPSLLDKPARRISRWVLEEAAGAAQPSRL